MSYELVKKDCFLAVGLSWEGTFAEADAGGIREVLKELHQRVNEIDYPTTSDEIIGLSYRTSSEGERFRHYSLIEVEKVVNIPDRMVAVQVPAMNLVKATHHKGEDVATSYQKVYQWIEQQGYTAANVEYTHMEIYPLDRSTYESTPEFTMLIPILEQEG